ncbi:MAG: permease-like cell division protein FtsX [Candidatus Yanofskybacteria bacterium]|nr:permease-like cell division protein FtsX [Candidatus Yanofskybacteria bacterium]
MFTSFKRITKSGWEKFFRDRSSSSASIIVMMVVIFLVSGLFILQGISAHILDSVESRVDVSAYFKKETLEQSILEAKEEMLRLPEVKEVEYVSSDEALRRFMETHSDDELVLQSLSAVGGNPLLAALHIKAWDPGSYALIADSVQESSFALQVDNVDYLDRAPVIQRITELSAAARTAVAGTSIVLAIIAILVAFNTVRLTIYNSREEIEIMRLVGASSWFIRGPFLIQGILSGMVATLFSLILLLPLVFVLSPKMQQLAPGFGLWDFFFSNLPVILFFQLLVGIGLGVLSALIAIRKHLRV